MRMAVPEGWARQSVNGRLNALIFRFAAKRTVHGVAVAVLGISPAVRRLAIGRITAALALLWHYDPVRCRRAAREMPHIVAGLPPSGDGCYDALAGLGVLSLEIVCRRETLPEQLALLIVHEATHARIARAGIRYEASRRARIERACVRAELAFAQRLPTRERAWYTRLLADRLAAPPDDFSDAAFIEREAQEGLRAGVPAWLVSLARRRRLRTLASAAGDRR